MHALDARGLGVGVTVPVGLKLLCELILERFGTPAPAERPRGGVRSRHRLQAGSSSNVLWLSTSVEVVRVAFEMCG